MIILHLYCLLCAVSATLAAFPYGWYYLTVELKAKCFVEILDRDVAYTSSWTIEAGFNEAEDVQISWTNRGPPLEVISFPTVVDEDTGLKMAMLQLRKISLPRRQYGQWNLFYECCHFVWIQDWFLFMEAAKTSEGNTVVELVCTGEEKPAYCAAHFDPIPMQCPDPDTRVVNSQHVW
ncbi:hypothetical protein E5Q_01299 [Mixia osmundae IAM 14324]|uniref:Autophagy-related protein 27 n=1 Tax=Mixia osmundae (strain CBS 9802 / IAM 14324 / JCM 22182 / KY 12970) TaxID=764103 RepID=G7DVN6_MIXOS|nr:hypothetical protein E5Q_01299 [Mixia osmundae IAM 14324]